ncbi:uncharacterized protein LOC134674456 [Cydia fagiglandana]|uniref:uncharacterized protein LOC134674456 n=1 Tax=Cydia fagiglandana TaxID=1458189 RepID=UPI002FEE1917
MDSEYDKKFEEMKQYIPFLEKMIKRLENTSSGSVNPRQAQLDKIRSLRDLLLDKKKRMKMDNLLKCEQVLINLYAKVEQGDTLPGIKPASEAIVCTDKTDLNLARSKLKTVTAKSHDPDTLPEIARATETEVGCSGTKEPALFQRRPNKGSLSPTKNPSSEKSPYKSSSKRNYTRVLQSPERSGRQRIWSPSEGPPRDENLFSRRSPPRPSRRHSPSYHKRERKKSSKESHSRKSKDLNITLKVPEERLNSLNTKDILSRIINCSERDVDIATLRELRTQILGELKQTGANEDISDLILKSYKNKKNKKSQSKNKADVEEGELSDSESEAIENIYGNLVVVEKDKTKDASSNQNKSSTEQDQVSRKIQICLVINSDKEETPLEASNIKNATGNQKICDLTDFEMFDDNNCGTKETDPIRPKPREPAYSTKNKDVVESGSQKTSTSLSPVKTNDINSTDIISINDVDIEKDGKVNYTGNIDMNDFDIQDNSNISSINEAPKSAPEPVPAPFKVNFYNSNSSDSTEINTAALNAENSKDQSLDVSKDKLPEPKQSLDKPEVVLSASKDKGPVESMEKNNETTKSTNKDVITTSTPSTESVPKPDAEIPLLNEPTVQPAKKDIVSEIDILQALKNEILSDTISLPCAEAITPALHQPKVTKVSNAQEELPKKRISIENYKKKSVPTNKPSLFVKNPRASSESKKEAMKLQSLKLTEKEVERFNLISKIALSDDSDDERDTGLKSPDDMDLAPKSPDMDITDDTPVSPPVIIPADPVKMVVVNAKADVDMRQLPPIMSPDTMSPFAPSTPILTKSDVNLEGRKLVDKPEVKKPVAPVDPRVRKDALLPSPPVAYPNMTPSRNPSVAPNMTPNRAPNMTPSRTPNMTPNSRTFDFNPNRPFNADDNGRKHVYAPMYSAQDHCERSPADISNWEMSNADREKKSGSKWEDRNPRSSHPQREDGPRSRYNDSNYDMGSNRSRNDRSSRDEYHRQEGPQQSNYYSRSDCPSTPTPSFGRGDAPSTPSHYFGRSECPRTPSHPFGRSESSNHSFGMSDSPRTPSHPFGRSEAPMTPSHPFGRSDAPMTPSHPFGRSEAPLTPSHPFGRSEAPPSHPFGRSDYSYPNPSPKYGKSPHDPRLNRSYDSESNSSRKDTGSYNDRNRYHRNDPRNFNREQSVPRNEPKPYTPDQTYRRDQMSRREPSVGRSMPCENDRERLYSRDRSRGPDNSRPYAEVGSRRTFQREPSAGQSMPDNRARASSVGRSVRNELSVESHAGRAFTIDTSVNSTFQKFLDSHRSNDCNFDARRQRASSVGRSLTREPSVGRTLPGNSFHRMEDNNRDRFKRAQSVGRELSTSRTEKSFKDVKAEFESYRNNDRKWNKDSQPTKPKENTNSRDPRIRRDSYDIQPNTKHSLNKTQGRETYDKTKKFNYRDPRQRKEQKINERSSYQYDRKRAESHDRHSYGISSDTGIKTPTISSVKNFKIPKIKRPEPDPKPTDVTQDIPDKINVKKSSSSSAVKDVNQKTTAEVKVDKKIKEGKKKSDQVSNKKKDNDKNTVTAKTDKKADYDEKNDMNAKSEKRVTRRSGRKNEETQSSVPSEEEIIQTRPRRIKKVIYDSDSDESVGKTNVLSKKASPKKYSPKTNRKSVQSDKNDVPQEESTETAIQENSNKSESSNEVIEPEDDKEKLDSTFGLDGIDLFPDNIISDPVLDNINSLIADLDNDLATSKTGETCNDLFNDISIENMLEKMTSSPLKKETKKTIEENAIMKDPFDTLKTETNKTECEKNDLFDTLKTETNETECEKSVNIVGAKKEESSNQTTDEQTGRSGLIPGQTESSRVSQPTIISQMQDKNDIEPVVSTSVNEEESSKNDQSSENEKILDGQSTPDSTNEAENMSQNYSEPTGDKPDSTIEKQCEMNSDISSTHDAENKPAKENIEIPKEPASQMDSIGSLLSILQDKSKIKELLSMLGDQSGENEKIKKKLEKLSEIVSDEENTNDDKIEDTTSIKTSENKNEMELVKQDNSEDVTKQKPIEEKILKQDDPEPDKPKETETCKMADSEPNVQTDIENKEKTIESVDNLSGNVSEDKTVTNQRVTDSAENNQDLEQKDESNDALNDVNSGLEDNEEEGVKKPDSIKTRKKVVRKGLRRFKTGKSKKGKPVKKVDEEKRVTRSEAAGLLMKPKQKKPSRELRQLQESIKEMFVSDAMLNATGIRMCRLAKMIDEKTEKSDDLESSQPEVSHSELSKPEPRVVLEKVKHIEENETVIEKPMRKKPGPKPKGKPAIVSPDEKKNKDEKPLVKYKPGPKSKTKIPQTDKDPYDFETDSINESKSSEKGVDSGSDSENESLASSKSFGSTELLVELKKKPKRKRGGWQSGVIKPKKKRKVEVKHAQSPPPKPAPPLKRSYTIPDYGCFTDKNYCFSKNTSEYQCRLCESTHSWKDIVFHYKKHHPHSEIPLSRMSPDIAREAIEQCGDIDFAAISKIPTEKYTCRFCFVEFGKRRAVLESFFWHVVSMHTGEYKQLCSECINVEKCPFNLDIPPPPKDIKGQLIGYICGKCNYTQISLENLKMHVIHRHNDTETEVYSINFAVMTKSTINSLIKRIAHVESTPRTTRSTRSNLSYTEASDDRSEITESELEAARPAKKSDVPVTEKPNRYSFNSKISFENDDNASDMSNFANTDSSVVKAERDEDDDMDDFAEDSAVNEDTDQIDENQGVSSDIMDYPHFKISYTDAGNKEYVCCINGKDNHYKTGLLISMKKHVQLKHSEIWDGYCFVCKVIVTSQGEHKFSECLTHYLDSHIDTFPVLEKVVEPVEKPVTPAATPEPVERAPTPYINVRPLAELVNPVEPAVEAPALPVIETVVSLLPVAPPTVEPPRPSPTYPVIRKETEPPKEYKYEEAQAEIMSKKHRVVLDAMMTPGKLVQIFKCAGRFCSFTTDSAEDALLHASTHQRVGGTNALLCAYCDFDSSGNSIDLVSHVFKTHGKCRVVCGLCFYRGAVSQLVASHIIRVHGSTPDRRCVLKTTSAPALCEPPEENMSRDSAVPLYVCKQTENNEPCGFKTVTHAKFWEHLTQRHENATGFICYVCSDSCPDATALILHLKTHGMRLYHCTLCVHGADNEPELLAHASAKHPGKNPQAYIRTILGMGGNLKILPLVELKKAALEPESITPNQGKENPVKEAERSIELEKLIGPLLDMPTTEPEMEPEAATPISEVLPEDNIVDDAISNLLEDPASAAMATLIPVSPHLPLTVEAPPRPVTPAPETNISKQLTPVLKEEPMDTTPEKNDSDVICLDSDEEDSKQGIVNLSDGIINLSDDEKVVDEQNPSTSAQAGNDPSNIFRCKKCNRVSKTFAGFKKHSYHCWKSGEKCKCALCPFEANKVGFFLKHHNDAHNIPARLKCPMCPHTDSSMYLLKKHLRVAHDVGIRDAFGTDSQYVLAKKDTGKARAVKRKSSGTAVGPPPKQKRYGPSDIDKLPINPILDESVFCDICEFNTKVRLNMVRHLQQHATQQPVAHTAPVNPVPHLETNEFHFDKMVNLASSSIANRAPEKTQKEPTPTLMIPHDKASRLPQYVPERYRYTCGATGCTYISVDEAMLKYHWETLHSGTNDYHCVHCPPHQSLDKSRPLTASRIIAHLKMHDIRLYACSVCPYYHYKRQLLEKHLAETHNNSGNVLVVREESSQSAPTAPTTAPTMDLKPWQCGLCKFKSMLRPEVAEHCSKMHQSKMQYKCAYCPFRTSTPENVTKHQTTAHPNREPEIFHFYYREGSIPNGPDGIPHWQKQRQKTGLDTVKAEADPPPAATDTILPEIQPPTAPQVNLNLVKQEIDPDAPMQASIEELFKKYGEFCEPNGLNYKCSLCKVVVEDSKEAMESHLFEELQYRKWGCRLCSYKAFHQTGLKEHVWSEHNRHNVEPLELTVDVNVESWVSQQLAYQEDLIKKNRDKLAQQKMLDERPVVPTTSKTVEVQNTTNLSMEKLEKIFGSLGVPINMQYCCPKCLFKTADDKIIQEHLEAELTRIRWCCSNCPNHFSTYHEAQFHCKSIHPGLNARPIEAARDPAIRSAWVAAVIRVQKLSMNCMPVTVISEPQSQEETNDDENSLLEIRYEEDVPIPDEGNPTQRRFSDSSDEDSLVIDEQAAKKSGAGGKCDHCDFSTKYTHVLDAHTLRHYNLKPFTCSYCNYNNYNKIVLQHMSTAHPNQPPVLKKTEKPTGPPLNLNLTKLGKKPGSAKKPVEDANLVCLICEKLLTEADSKAHIHDQKAPEFARRGDIVVKCSECLKLFLDVVSMQRHFTLAHPDMPIKYAYYKTDHDTRSFVYCSHCNQRFTYMIDLKAHHNQVHSALKLKYTKFVPGDEGETVLKAL